MQKDRQAYQGRRKYVNSHIDDIVRIQASIRMALARKKYKDRLQYFKDNVCSPNLLASFSLLAFVIVNVTYYCQKTGDSCSWD